MKKRLRKVIEIVEKPAELEVTEKVPDQDQVSLVNDNVTANVNPEEG